ncbi:hypothetical protein JL722_1687 [Aureococcus anophagefferens]|nr:hypothetical protein JL722_1687 [Aureococcus anophagefferens]
MSMTPAMQAEIKILPGNDRCVDCGGPHPQWASVTFGALMCLECSGAHRGMGVHISFVRSVTMDSWNEKQLALMKGGGNADLIAFWKKHGVDPRMPHNAKYHEPASELYKDRLRAKVEGKPLPTQLPQRKAAPASCYDAPGGGSIAQQLKAKTAETAQAAWGGLRSWGSKLSEGLKDLTVREDDASDLGSILQQRRSSGALGTGKQMDGVGSGGFGGSRSGSMSGMGSQGSGFGSQGSGFGSQGSGGFGARTRSRRPTTAASAARVRAVLRQQLAPQRREQRQRRPPPGAPARSASNPAPVSALPPPAPVSRSSSAVGAGATPGKPSAVDKDDDFFSDFGV